FWHDWTKQFKPQSESADSVLRSLLVLKALSHRDTGGMVAAATTSLPECLGGARNWDYRYCWLRDATFTLYALIGVGCLQEARAWRDWLIRAVGGNPNQIQVLYGLAGERRVPEYELPWLPGYENSAPVRIGNAAAGQLQIDVYGEVMDALYLARKAGLGPDEASWALECALLEHLETIWHRPDHGMWEVRGKTQQFTHSKVMAWVAFDRALRSVAEFGLEGPSEHWRAVRDRIHQEVCERGFNVETQTFVQYFGGTELDANLLRLALVGFLPPEDPRIRSTVTAIERDLMCDGLVLRYRSHRGVDEVRGEGAFLACSFWLADNYVLQGRNDEARELFQRLLSLRNDVGLLAEEYDSKTQRQVGNFPQAFSHLSLINTALNLAGAGPAHKRSARKPA
ncbi:MAG TPA: glycoside hydrolase family 15 protein, partial [Steroidobacteraceae bacterium]|nr:glycoside hydrolase family 15 protein [Steroidobacteraceae bacterium]